MKKVLYECESELLTQSEYELMKRFEEEYGDNVYIADKYIMVDIDDRKPRYADDWLIHPYTRRNGETRCFCKTPLSAGYVDMYPHSGGLPVIGKAGNQWVYVHCRKCGYEWSFQHLQWYDNNEN